MYIVINLNKFGIVSPTVTSAHLSPVQHGPPALLLFRAVMVAQLNKLSMFVSFKAKDPACKILGTREHYITI